MKKLSLTLLGLALAFSAFTQGNIQILYDSPPDPKINVNFEYFNVDMGVKNIDGASFNIGTFGFVEPVSKIGFNWMVRKSIFTFGALGADVPGNLEINAGAYSWLGSNTVVKPTKVVLNKEYKGSEYNINSSGDIVETRTEAVTFVHVPAHRLIKKGLRAGFYMKNGPMGTDNVETGELSLPYDGLGLTTMGVYAGVSSRSIKNIFIKEATHGVQFNSIGDDFYADVMILPVNIFRDMGTDGNPVVTDVVKNSLGSFPLGFRIGWQRYQVEKKLRTGKTLGMAAAFEAGFKPYQGVFFNGSLGFTLVKK